jgi:hypothetical protein
LDTHLLKTQINFQQATWNHILEVSIIVINAVIVVAAAAAVTATTTTTTTIFFSFLNLLQCTGPKLNLT